MVAGFQQAALAVEKAKEFEELVGTIRRALGSEKSESFLKQLQSGRVCARDFEAVLAKGIFDRLESNTQNVTAKLYSMLPISDQAQVREFYLSKIEEVDPALRTRFKRLYQYY